MSLVRPVLSWQAASRIEEIRSQFHLDISPIGASAAHVSSVNAPETADLLIRFDPELVVVNGTRIISDATLQKVTRPFINTHAGVTPAFRGSHGGYWALATGHDEFAGVTIHRVDAGIDTGQILKQGAIQVTPRDSFVTYPYLQLGVGIPLLISAIHELLTGTAKLETLNCPLPSKLYYNPTLFEYFALRLKAGIR
jgi:folate-dependent phosphoribosylglycinamide formyltransferase PurN